MLMLLLMVPAPGQETNENQGKEEEKYIEGLEGYLDRVFREISTTNSCGS